jgi:GNAT superfamily N-acetyltransferase
MGATAELTTSWNRDGYRVSTDRARLNVGVIHGYLTGYSYWARGVPRQTVQRAIDNSLCFGLFLEVSGEQVGFARLITDTATFAYLADVFVLDEHRGRGLSKWMMQLIVDHPSLQGLRRWMLGTADAHSLYTQYGFKPLAKPERIMERHFPDIYTSIFT